MKDSVSDRCSRIYCRKCLKIWYGHDLKKFRDHRSFVCHFCNGDCCCSRCQRKENLLKIAGFYQSLGGDVDSLIDNSPISLLIDRIIKMSRPKVMKTMKPKKALKKKTAKAKKKKKTKNSGALKKEEIRFLELQIALNHLTSMHKLVLAIRKREEYKTLHTHIDNCHFLSRIQHNKNAKIKVDSPLEQSITHNLVLGRPLDAQINKPSPFKSPNAKDFPTGGSNLVTNNIFVPQYEKNDPSGSGSLKSSAKPTPNG